MTEAPYRYGNAPRGVSAGDIERAADALLRAGERPTIEKVREKLGTGSPNTINPLLDAGGRDSPPDWMPVPPPCIDSLNP